MTETIAYVVLEASSTKGGGGGGVELLRTAFGTNTGALTAWGVIVVRDSCTDGDSGLCICQILGMLHV